MAEEQTIKKKKPKKEKASTAATCPEWMLTMGDCMSLLLTFFVMLLSFASLDPDQLLNVNGALRGALGIMRIEGIQTDSKQSPSYNAPEVEDKTDTSMIDKSELQKAIILQAVEINNRYDQLKEKLHSLGLQNVITFDILTNGIKFTIDQQALFQTDDSLSPTSALLLQGIANISENAGNEMRLTYRMKDKGDAEGAWDQSIKRLGILSDHFKEKYKLHPTRFGYSIDIKNELKKEVIEIALLDKFGTREVNLKDLWSDSMQPFDEEGN